MTHKEVTEKVQQNQHSARLKELEAGFNFSHLDISVEKKGFADIYQYVSRIQRGWENLDEALPPELQESKNRIQKLYKSLNQFLSSSEQFSPSQLNSQWGQVQNEIRALNSDKVLITDSPITTFLIDLFKNYGNRVYNGAFIYLLRYFQGHTFSSPEELTGAFKAYEFKYQDETQIVKRRAKEKASVSRLRNEFEKYFTETSQHLSESLKESRLKVEKLSEEFDNSIKEKNESFRTWFNETEEDYRKFYNKASESITDNEDLYKRKLMLEAPASYWRDRARTLKKEGNNWLYSLIGASIVVVVILLIILGFLSSGTLEEIFKDAGSAIKFSVIFITIVSFLAFAVRTFAKLAFSSFHLVRDAEEREQLSYFYLALTKEKNIDEAERHLVMQSLFSRSDSGLLKEDSTPTMPGNIYDKFFTKGQ